MGKSIWQDYASSKETGLKGNLQTDILIVGSGIAGLTTAYTLLEAGMDVQVADAGQPAQTSLTTAHLASVLDDRFVNMERWHGEDGSKLACESHRKAIDFIETFAEKNGIECGFKRVNGYLFAANRQDSDFLAKELGAARRAGHDRAELLPRTPLLGLESHPCIRFPDQAQFDPGLYMRALLQVLEEKGLPIHSGVRVQSWEKSKKGLLLKTEQGPEITCKKVVFCCNDPFVRFRYYAVHAPYRSYAVALECGEAPKETGLYWDTLDPYHYLRFHEDPAAGTVMIVGGEDHKTGQTDDAASSWNRLEHWARHRFPSVGKCVARWSGQILETMDGLALIGADPAEKEQVFLSSGDSGMGLTHGTLGALLLADVVQGKEHRWKALYDPGRFRWRAGGECARENANVFRQYLHHLKPAPKEAPTGKHGVLVQRGRKKIARQGGKDLCATCPHLGGLVAWNDAEQTWDCECHGSRFTAAGEVLNGPAVSPLKPAKG